MGTAVGSTDASCQSAMGGQCPCLGLKPLVQRGAHDTLGIIVVAPAGAATEADPMPALWRSPVSTCCSRGTPGKNSNYSMSSSACFRQEDNVRHRGTFRSGRQRGPRPRLGVTGGGGAVSSEPGRKTAVPAADSEVKSVLLPVISRSTRPLGLPSELLLELLRKGGRRSSTGAAAPRGVQGATGPAEASLWMPPLSSTGDGGRCGPETVGALPAQCRCAPEPTLPQPSG